MLRFDDDRRPHSNTKTIITTNTGRAPLITTGNSQHQRYNNFITCNHIYDVVERLDVSFGSSLSSTHHCDVDGFGAARAEARGRKGKARLVCRVTPRTITDRLALLAHKLEAKGCQLLSLSPLIEAEGNCRFVVARAR
jgi:hypothetical protein